MFNSVVIGNITRIEPKTIDVSENRTRDLLEVDIAVHGREAFFIKVDFWDKTANSQRENLTKGSLVAIIGEPIFTSYLKKDGEAGFEVKFRNPQVKYIYMKQPEPDETETVEPGEQQKLPV